MESKSVRPWASVVNKTPSQDPKFAYAEDIKRGERLDLDADFALALSLSEEPEADETIRATKINLVDGNEVSGSDRGDQASKRNEASGSDREDDQDMYASKRRAYRTALKKQKKAEQARRRQTEEAEILRLAAEREVVYQ